jgi:hypothetical protein
MFDDGAGPPNVHSQSRGLKLHLDFKTMTATEIVQDLHSPGLLAQYEGSDNELENYDDFIDWGQQPYFSDTTTAGSSYSMRTCSTLTRSTAPIGPRGTGRR